MKNRCGWAGSDPLYVRYHDEEWGVPVYDDRKHFEFLILESAQAGLSWLTVLKKRKNYQQAFCRFNPKRVARFGKAEINALLRNAGIIRNRLKIEAAINNARCFLEVQKEFGSFTDYCWQFVGGRPMQNRWKNIKQLPAKTEISDTWSLDLKKRGFKFVGSTIMYAHMQAVGMVNDHTTGCFRHKQLAQK